MTFTIRSTRKAATKPLDYYKLSEGVGGIAKTCRKLDKVLAKITVLTEDAFENDLRRAFYDVSGKFHTLGSRLKGLNGEPTTRKEILTAAFFEEGDFIDPFYARSYISNDSGDMLSVRRAAYLTVSKLVQHEQRITDPSIREQLEENVDKLVDLHRELLGKWEVFRERFGQGQSPQR